MPDMSHVLNALLPVFILIALGFALRQHIFKSDNFWKPIEQITYYILFPALIVSNMAETEVHWNVVFPVLSVLAAATLIISALVMLIRNRFCDNGAGYTSVFQGSIRFNTYVGLSAAAALYGKTGVTLLAVIIALMIPLVNLLSVYTITRYGANGRTSFNEIARELATNPLIIGSALGIAINLAGIPLPFGIRPSVDSLGKASLPLGLLAVGSGLNMRTVKGNIFPLFFPGILKLLLLPLLVWFGSRIAGLDTFTMSIGVLYAALPTAPSAFILARSLGGDHTLMARIITIQTVAASLTLPVFLMTLG